MRLRLAALIAALIAATLLPSAALAQSLTFEELGALHPEQTCFTMHPDLELLGMPVDVGSIDPASFLEGRGGDYNAVDVGDISLVGGPWTYDSLSYDALYGSLNAFLGSHENEYDFVTLFVTEHLNFGALYSPLQNTTSGLGTGQFDSTSDLGYGELEGYLFMNSIFDYTGSLHDALFFGQEVGHRWGSFVRRAGGGRDMLGRDEAHWSFFLDSDNSTMEGNDWERISDDRWETNADHEVGYSELDMYLMGFMDPDDVEDWLLIGNPQVLSHSGIEASSPPYYAILDSQPGVSPIVVRGDEIQVSIEDVMSINGSRQPDFEDSQREFKMAFVIMHPASQALDFDDYLVIEDTREDLTELWEDMVDDEAVLDTSLGTSGDYEINPAGLPGGIAFEPDPTDGSVGSGCTASIAGASAGSLGLLLPLALLRRRRNA